MARARNIKPGFFTNDELADLPMATRLLFIGLWTLADREGRLQDRPRKIKMEIFPADDVDVDEALVTLERSAFIQRYTVDGGAFIQVENFSKHQRPHSNESASPIPPPTTSRKKKARNDAENNEVANHGEQGGAPRQSSRAGAGAIKTDTGYRIPDTGLSDTGKIEAADAARRDAPPGLTPTTPSASSRTERQQVNDQKHDRRVALFAAWCRGVGVDPDGEDAAVGRSVAFKQLKSIVDQPVPLPEAFERCTRYLVSQQWRDDPPSIPQVIQAFAKWTGQGSPDRARDRSAPSIPGQEEFPADGGLAEFRAMQRAQR